MTQLEAEIHHRVMEDLLPLLRREVIATTDTAPVHARAVLERYPRTGSVVLAGIIRELLRCRCPEIIWALALVRYVRRGPALTSVLNDVATAEAIRHGEPGQFDPEIAGAGQIGWTDGTADRVRRLAGEALGRDAGEKTGCLRIVAALAVALVLFMLIPAVYELSLPGWVTASLTVLLVLGIIFLIFVWASDRWPELVEKLGIWREQRRG